MGQLYISAFTADFRHYDDLWDWIHSDPEISVGAELAVAWHTPDFDALLEPQIPRFREVPVTLHGPFMEMCPAVGSGEEAQLQQQMERSCRLYQRLNARSIVLHTHLGPGAAYERVLEVLNHWIPRMTACGMAVTVENVGYPAKGNALFTQRSFIRLFDELPEETGCLIDLGHALLNQWDILALIRTMGTKIKGYHIHTNDGAHDSHFPIHDSRSVLTAAQMDEILGTIGEVTPDAHLILEYASRDIITKELLRQDLRHLASLCCKKTPQD